MDILLFVLRRLLTRSFWFLVGSTMVAVLMMAIRSQQRDTIFKTAQQYSGKSFFKRY